jgi:hypothetical protein
MTGKLEFRDAIRLSGGECNNRFKNKLNKINKFEIIIYYDKTLDLES